MRYIPSFHIFTYFIYGLTIWTLLGCDTTTQGQLESEIVSRQNYTDAQVASNVTDQNIVNDMQIIRDLAQVDYGKIRARFKWEGDDFYRMPWPSDARLTPQGTPNLEDFPGSTPTLEKIKQYLQSSIQGYSLMPVIYMPFQDALQDTWLPSIENSTAVDSSIQLISLDPSTCNRRIPIDSSISQADDDYLTEHVLQIRNAWGSVLTPGKPHALIVLSTFGDEQNTIVSPDEFQEAWQGDTHPLSPSLQPLKDCLPQLGLQAEHIALATVFTPQDPRQKLLALHQHVVDPQQIDTRAVHDWHQSEAWSRRRIKFKTMQGLLPMPIFQQGDTPYELEGGDILFDENGQARVQRWEDVPVAVSFKEEGNFDPNDRPVIVFIDGTGWSKWSHVRGNWMYEAINQGYVIYSFMPQFHGERAEFTGSDMLATFNLLNPVAGGTNFIQQAVEISYFARALQEQMITLDGLPQHINTDRMLYAAQSQGSLCGAMHAAVSDQFAAYVLNGVSSSITLTMLYRDDLLNFRTVMSGFLQTSPEALNLFHPALQLIQLGSDAVDPNSYAPYWKGWEGQPYGNHVFVINGQKDQTTRPLGMANLSLVSQAYPLAPFIWDLKPYLLDQFITLPWPLSLNHQNVAEQPLTIASFLDQSSGHFTVYGKSRVREVVYEFWRSTLMGTPHIKSTSEIHCDDGLDDDEDDLIDCDDPDCQGRSTCEEQVCDDGLDDDGDELIDCEDPGCADQVPCTELCNNDEDDNGDDLIDCDDPICSGKNRCRENQCDDEEDDDDDGLFDCDDPDCVANLHCPEAICDDGIDQNQDQMTDCSDIGCSWSDVCRQAYETVCDDGLDDDGDELIDCDDPDCASDLLCAQVDACWQIDLGSQLGFMVYEGYLDMMSNRYVPGDCTSLGSGEGSQDFAFLWTAPQAATYQITTYGSELDTVLVLYPQPDEECQVDLELACNDDLAYVQSSRILYAANAEETIMIVVSPYNAEESDLPFRLHINRVLE